LLYNTTANGNHWLLIQTIGTKTTVTAIGTQISSPSVRLGEFNQVTTAEAMRAFGQRVHFGLGRDKLVGITLDGQRNSSDLAHVKVEQISGAEGAL